MPNFDSYKLDDARAAGVPDGQILDTLHQRYGDIYNVQAAAKAGLTPDQMLPVIDQRRQQAYGQITPGPGVLGRAWQGVKSAFAPVGEDESNPSPTQFPLTVASGLDEGATKLGGALAEKTAKTFPNLPPAVPAAAGMVAAEGLNPLNWVPSGAAKGAEELAAQAPAAAEKAPGLVSRILNKPVPLPAALTPKPDMAYNMFSPTGIVEQAQGVKALGSAAAKGVQAIMGGATAAPEAAKAAQEAIQAPQETVQVQGAGLGRILPALPPEEVAKVRAGLPTNQDLLNNFRDITGHQLNGTVDPSGIASEAQAQLVDRALAGKTRAQMAPDAPLDLQGNQLVQNIPAETYPYPTPKITHSLAPQSPSGWVNVEGLEQHGPAEIVQSTPTGTWVKWPNGKEMKMVGAELTPVNAPAGIQEAAQAGREAPVIASPEPPAQHIIEQPQAQDTHAQIDGAQVRQVDPKTIGIDPERFQFKESNAKGIQTPLKGDWDPYKAGNVLLWQDESGRNWIVNGHHRLDKALDAGAEGINAQVVRAADGISQKDAMILGAEQNIAEGKGTVYDHAKFFRLSKDAGEEYSPTELSAKALNGPGYAIGTKASDDLYASFQAGKISPANTAAIVDSAGANAADQAIGLKYAIRTPKAAPSEVSNFIEAAKSVRAQNAGPQEMDLFGATNDTALKQAESMSKAAQKLQDDVRAEINAARGAVKNPELAAKSGVQVTDQNAALGRLEKMKTLAERLDPAKWGSDPEMVDWVRRHSVGIDLPLGKSIDDMSKGMGMDLLPGGRWALGKALEVARRTGLQGDVQETMQAMRTAEEASSVKDVRHLPIPVVGKFLDNFMPTSYRIEKWSMREARIEELAAKTSENFYTRYKELTAPITKDAKAMEDLAYLLDGNPVKGAYRKDVVDIATKVRELDDAFHEYTGRSFQEEYNLNHYPRIKNEDSVYDAYAGEAKDSKLETNYKRRQMENAAGYTMDPDKAFGTYFLRTARQTNVIRFVESVRTEMQQMAKSMSAADNEYVNAWLARLQNQPGSLEQTLDSMANFTAKAFGQQLNTAPTRRLANAISQKLYSSFLGFNFTTPFKHTAQLREPLVDAGFKSFFQGMKILTKDGKIAFNESGIPGGFVQDVMQKSGVINDSRYQRLLDIGMTPMEKTMNFIKGYTYHVGIADGIKKGVIPTDLPRYAADFVQRNIGRAGKGEMSPYLDNPLGKMVGMFVNTPLKVTLYYTKLFQDQQYAKLARYLAVTGAVYAGGKSAGLDLSKFIGVTPLGQTAVGKTNALKHYIGPNTAMGQVPIPNPFHMADLVRTGPFAQTLSDVANHKGTALTQDALNLTGVPRKPLYDLTQAAKQSVHDPAAAVKNYLKIMPQDPMKAKMADLQEAYKQREKEYNDRAQGKGLMYQIKHALVPYK